MKISSFPFASLLLALIPLFSHPAIAAFPLVVGGEPQTTIVIPENAKPAEKYAAEELQYHIQKASGATLPIVTEAETGPHVGARIQVGATAENKELIKLPHPERFEWDREQYPWEGRLTETGLHFFGVDGDGEITGKESSRSTHESQPLGTLFAVYDFLESQLGVRWIWPGESGEDIPVRKDIVLESYEMKGIPRLINAHWRAWAAATNRTEGWSSKAARDEYLADQRQWLIRQRFRRLSPLAGFEGLVSDFQARKADPDIVAMTPNGKRDIFYRTQPSFKSFGWRRVAMCVANPNLPRLYMDKWERELPKISLWANSKIAGVNETDIPGYCVCELCRKWDAPDERFRTNPYWRGEIQPKTVMEMWQALSSAEGKSPSLSDRYAKFWLAVQKEAATRDPDSMIWAYAYANYASPPKETKLNDRIIVKLVGWPYLTWTAEDSKKINQQWDGWRATGANLMLRPNTTYMGHGLPVFYAKRFAQAFSHAAKNGLVGTDFDTLTGQWGTQGPTLYTIARMHSHPDEPVDEILDEFYSAFGPAKAEVQAYFEHWEQVSNALTSEEVRKFRDQMKRDWETLGTPRISRVMIAANLFPPAAMARGRELLEEAKTAAEGDEIAEKRVRVLDLGLRDSELMLETLNAYRDFTQTRDFKTRLALNTAIKAQKTFRIANEKDMRQNLSWLTQQENSLWGQGALAKLKPGSDNEEAVDAQ